MGLQADEGIGNENLSPHLLPCTGKPPRQARSGNPHWKQAHFQLAGLIPGPVRPVH